MGHDRKSDELFFRSLAESKNGLDKINLYTFCKENYTKLIKKTEIFEQWFQTDLIELKYHD